MLHTLLVQFGPRSSAVDLLVVFVSTRGLWSKSMICSSTVSLRSLDPNPDTQPPVLFRIFRKRRQQSTRVDSFFSIVTDDYELLDCFVHLPDQHEVPFLMDSQKIAEAQAQDAVLLQQVSSKATEGATTTPRTRY
jgi:hypothetical protein